MAVLDRFLNVMFDKDAEAVVLETGKQVVLEIESGRHPDPDEAYMKAADKGSMETMLTQRGIKPAFKK